MAKEEGDVSKIVEAVERLLDQHQQELLRRLDAWERSHDNDMPRGMTMTSNKVPGEDAFVQKKRKRSYDEARLTHVQMVEATQAAEPAQSEPSWNDVQSLRTRCRQFMDSNSAHVFFAGLIISNSVFLGVQLEMQAIAEDIFVEQTLFTSFHIAYAVLFTLELVLRLLAEGFLSCFWFSGDWAWNCLDAFVVLSSWVELVISAFEPAGSGVGANRNLRVLRLLRFGRLVRVVRVVRVAKLFRSLRTLINSLVGTLKSLFWSLLLLALIMYMFGIIFTDAVLDYRYANDFSETEDALRLTKHFGSLYSSIDTLFRSISNGLTWGEAADALRSMDIVWTSLFQFYVAFCSFAVLNVMTGTFCNAAIKAAERDHDMLVLSLVQTRRDLRDQVENLFHRIDQRGVGQVTIDDFEKHFSDEAVIAFFESLEIGAMDAWTLFLSLDVDGDHTISVDEFTERCLQLHGPARSADIFALRRSTEKLEEYLLKLANRQQHLHHSFTELLDDLGSRGLTEPVKLGYL